MHQPSKHILRLLGRFLEKEATEQEIDELQSWLNSHPHNILYFKKVKEKHQAKIFTEFDPRQTQAAWTLLTAKLFPHISRGALKIGTPRMIPYRVWKIAAAVSVLVIASFAIWETVTHTPATIPSEHMLAFQSHEKNAQFMLPDSSWVWLNDNSSIEYPKNFNEKREVRLKGEAFFDVRKKQRKNFVVLTEHLSIQVKGTRFNVRAYSMNDENATLEEGEIELTIKGDENTYSMAPGDQITIHQHEQRIIRKKVNPTNFSAWKESKLVFDNALLADIIAKLENRYPVNIIIDSAIAQRERLTMTIEHEPIEDILEMIQLSSMLDYRIEKDQILIYE
jgi:transmembrane sensor